MGNNQIISYFCNLEIRPRPFDGLRGLDCLNYKLKSENTMEKKDLLKDVVEHIDIKKYDSTELINAMRKMSFTSRDTARAADILCQMIAEKDCTNILTIAGSTSAAGCMQVYVEMVRNKMVDAVVSTGASIIDMDLFEALGYKHYTPI